MTFKNLKELENGLRKAREDGMIRGVNNRAIEESFEMQIVQMKGIIEEIDKVNKKYPSQTYGIGHEWWEELKARLEGK